MGSWWCWPAKAALVALAERKEVGEGWWRSAAVDLGRSCADGAQGRPGMQKLVLQGRKAWW